MINTQTKEGVHVKRRKAKNRTQKQMVNLKTQDMMYYVAAKQSEKQKIERLQNTLHFLDPNARPNKHTVFVDSFDQALTFNPGEYFNTLPELVNRSFNRPTLGQLQSDEVHTVPMVAGTAATVAKTRKRQYTELQQRLQREKSLSNTIQKLSQKRAVMMSKGAAVKKVKVEDGKGNVRTLFKWQKVRRK